MSPEILDSSHANVDQHGFFCFMSKRKNPGWQSKRQWLEQRFAEGLRIKLLKLPERGFIEYVPGEYAWRPILAKDYLVIHCLWVVGRSKGKGNAAALLAECLQDAREGGFAGVAMVVSDIGYMKWKGFLAKHGFAVVDTAPPCYQLMAIQFRDAPLPMFCGGWEKKASACGAGVTLLKTDQCPYFADFTDGLLGLTHAKKLPVKVIELKSAQEVRDKAPSPYGTYSVVIDGRVVPIYEQAKKAI